VATIIYRKTSGAGVGTIGQGTTFVLTNSVQNIGGTLTLDIVQNSYTGIINAIEGVSATIILGGGNTITIVVTGVASDNINWNTITKVNTVQ
jgi:hypothetical protein